MPLTFGIHSNFEEKDYFCVPLDKQYLINEFIYCNNGVFSHLEGFEELVKDGVITEYYQLKTHGYEFTTVSSSGDRAACFTVEARTKEDLLQKHAQAVARVKVVGMDGTDLKKSDILHYLGGCHL